MASGLPEKSLIHPVLGVPMQETRHSRRTAVTSPSSLQVIECDKGNSWVSVRVGELKRAVTPFAYA